MSRRLVPLLLVAAGCPGAPAPVAPPVAVVAVAPVNAGLAPDAAPCPECEDGFGENCYVHRGLHAEGCLRSGISMPPETEAACFALESYSSCHTCYHHCSLRRDGELVAVSCAEMGRAIEEKNRACGDCLYVVQSGCC